MALARFRPLLRGLEAALKLSKEGVRLRHISVIVALLYSPGEYAGRVLMVKMAAQLSGKLSCKE